METTQWVVGSWVQGYEKNDFYQWLIVPKDLGQPIGTISVVDHNDSIKKCEIGYCIGKAWWHQGFVSESLKAVIRFLFDEVGINRIEARHDTNNPQFRSCYEKVRHEI